MVLRQRRQMAGSQPLLALRRKPPSSSLRKTAADARWSARTGSSTSDRSISSKLSARSIFSLTSRRCSSACRKRKSNRRSATSVASSCARASR